MKYFLDTEFTDFVNSELISVGIVSEDGKKEFYIELKYDPAKCSEFVKAVVVPLLNNYLYTKQEANEKLVEWIRNIDDKNMVIVYDYGLDEIHFSNLLRINSDPEIKSRIKLRLLQNAILSESADLSDSKLISSKFKGFDFYREEYFKHTGATRHHALADARAMRHSWKMIF